MYDALKEDHIVDKVGGRFRLSALIQKRLAALNKGAPPMVDTRSNDKMAMVIREIMEDKIKLDTMGQLRTAEPSSEDILGAKVLGDFDLSDE